MDENRRCDGCGYEVPRHLLVDGLCFICYDEEQGFDNNFEKLPQKKKRKKDNEDGD